MSSTQPHHFPPRTLDWPIEVVLRSAGTASRLAARTFGFAAIWIEERMSYRSEATQIRVAEAKRLYAIGSLEFDDGRELKKRLNSSR